MDSNEVTFSVTLNKSLYDSYKALADSYGKSINDGLVSLIKSAVDYTIPNEDTMKTLTEVEHMKQNNFKDVKVYSNLDELFNELETEDSND